MTAQFRKFALQSAIAAAGVVAHEAGAEISVRKPGGGEMRGLSLQTLIQGDYNSLESIAPRITSPTITKQQFAAMDPADMTQFHLELLDFLLPSAAKQAVSPTE